MNEYSEVISEYLCHQPLKGCRCVAVTLLHYMRDKGAKWGSEGHLPDVLILHSNLFVGIGHVNFCSKSGLSNVHSNLVLVWEWGDILKCVIILFPGVDHTRFEVCHSSLECKGEVQLGRQPSFPTTQPMYTR